MRTIALLVLATLACVTLTLPFKHQIALLNSLEVGREEDPMAWTCAGCEEDTRPSRSHVVEEDAVKIRAILSVYEEYTVLAFRYTANLKNVWQDLLYPIQVDLLPFRLKTTTHPKDARSKENMTACGKKSEMMSSETLKQVFIPEDSSSLVSAWEEALLASVTLTSRPQEPSTMLRLSVSVLLESETRNGLSSSTPLPNTPEFTSVVTPSLSFPFASLLSAATDILEKLLFVTTTVNPANLKNQRNHSKMWKR